MLLIDSFEVDKRRKITVTNVNFGRFTCRKLKNLRSTSRISISVTLLFSFCFALCVVKAAEYVLVPKAVPKGEIITSLQFASISVCHRRLARNKQTCADNAKHTQTRDLNTSYWWLGKHGFPA